MTPILQIALNDVRLFLKDKVGYVWLFLAPIGFIYFTGIPTNRPQSDPSNPRPSVEIENLDTGFMGKLLMDELGTQGFRVLDPKPDQASDRRIIIPEDFTEKIKRQERAKLNYIKKEGSADESAAMVEMRLIQTTLAMNAHLVEWVTQTTDTNSLSEAALLPYFEDADPIELKASFAGRNPVPRGFEQSLPGNLVMFMMMNLLIFGGVSIAEERKNGVLRRLAALPLTRGQIVTGKILGRFLLGIVLIVFFLLLGTFGFGVQIGQAPFVLLLALSLFAWLAASLGVLIGSITSSPDKTIGLCVMLSMLMGALGGCWWPLEITNETMQFVGHLIPTGWAMDVLHQLISFGGGFAEVKNALIMLGIFALGMNLLAARFLKYTEA